mmetsp:Transcript_4866/g.9493  ORF Transcript_4866/g.9493 Transcript_4866/m.9493 type:complete len:286 (+) Transcript_4866:631-1488(+)
MQPAWSRITKRFRLKENAGNSKTDTTVPCRTFRTFPRNGVRLVEDVVHLDEEGGEDESERDESGAQHNLGQPLWNEHQGDHPSRLEVACKPDAAGDPYRQRHRPRLHRPDLANLAVVVFWNLWQSVVVEVAEASEGVDEQARTGGARAEPGRGEKRSHDREDLQRQLPWRQPRHLLVDPRCDHPWRRALHRLIVERRVGHLWTECAGHALPQTGVEDRLLRLLYRRQPLRIFTVSFSQSDVGIHDLVVTGVLGDTKSTVIVVFAWIWIFSKHAHGSQAARCCCAL